MSVKTNSTVFSIAKEQSPGVLPGTADWYELERTEIGDFSATLTTTAADPINQNRMQEKGAITDLDAAFSFTNDLTYSQFKLIDQAFFYANRKQQPTFVPTAVTSTGYTVASGGDLTAGTLIYAKRFQDSSNNGLKVVGAASTATEIKTSGLVAEATPPDGVVVETCGFQGATGDIELDSDGNLISTILDFTGVDTTIYVGQRIWVGGFESATQFATSGYTGLARVRAVETNKITLDKRDWTVGAADSGAGKTIQILVGSYIRNVTQDDSDFVEETFTAEAKYPGTEQGTRYEYASGCKPNEIAFSLPLSAFVTINPSFIAQDVPIPTDTQESGNRLTTYDRARFSSVADCLRVSLCDAENAEYTTYFKSLDITIANGVSPEKVLCNLGSVDANIGKFIVSGSTQTLFTDVTVLTAVRNNLDVSVDFALSNGDGVLAFDIPRASFSTATKSFPADESVLIDFDITTSRDEFFNHVMSVTEFPLPIGDLRA